MVDEVDVVDRVDGDEGVDEKSEQMELMGRNAWNDYMNNNDTKSSLQLQGILLAVKLDTDYASRTYRIHKHTEHTVYTTHHRLSLVSHIWTPNR